MKEIDLAVSGPCCMTEPSAHEPYYPSVTIESDEKTELPNSGAVTFHFKKVTETIRVDKQGETHYSCTLELRKLVDSDESDEKPEEKEMRADEALDKLAEEKMKSRKSKEY